MAVTNYNYGRFLSGCIDSILEQTVPAHEIVVVDDGSTDDSLAVLAGYGDKVTVVATENRGVAGATNTAIGHCTGDVVALLDADDLMRPDRIQRLTDAYQQHPDAQWVWHRLSYIHRATSQPAPGPGELVGYTVGWHDHRTEVAKGQLPITMPATSALSWRTGFLRRVTPMPSPMRSQDNYLKFVSLGLAPGVVLDEALAVQGIHDGNAYTTATGPERRRFQMLSAVDIAPGLREVGLSGLERRMVASALVGTRGGVGLSPKDRSRLRREVKTTGAALLPWVVVESARASLRILRRR